MDASVAVGVVGVFVALAIGGWQIALARRQAPQNHSLSHFPEGFEPGRITKISAKRELVPVDFVIHSTGDRVKLELPQDARTGDLIPDLVHVFRLPQRYEDGRAVSLEICSEDRGVALDADLTIRQNGVVPNETLAIRARSLFG